MKSGSGTGIQDTWNYTEIFNSLDEPQKEQLNDINSESGVRCALRIWYNSSKSDIDQGSFCGGLWDNIYCWPPTHSGMVASTPCSEVLQELHPGYASHLEGNAHRTCLENGSWAREDESIYRECLISFESHLKLIDQDKDVIPVVNHMLFFGSILSLICLGASLTIFSYFRCLRCDRVTVQVHLMLALVLRFMVMLVIAEPLVFGRANSYRNVDILCETVLIIFLYTTFTTTSWMFVQGLYLNVTLMSPGINVMSKYHLTIYYIVGWVAPAGFTVVYVIAMLLKKQEKCWEGYSKMDERWILLGPIIFELVVNGLFLLNILRILLRKVRNSNSRPDLSQLKAAAKATAVLFPVLGINNLLLLFNPGGEYGKYFVTLNTFFGSTQGVFVAIVYCFINKEVWGAIRRSIIRMQARYNGNFACVRNNERPQAISMVELNSKPRDDQTHSLSLE